MEGEKEGGGNFTSFRDGTNGLRRRRRQRRGREEGTGKGMKKDRGRERQMRLNRLSRRMKEMEEKDLMPKSKG